MDVKNPVQSKTLWLNGVLGVLGLIQWLADHAAFLLPGWVLPAAAAANILLRWFASRSPLSIRAPIKRRPANPHKD